MSTARALDIDSILDEIIWHIHSGSCTIERCQGFKRDLDSIQDPFHDSDNIGNCQSSHRKSLLQTLTVSKKWFRVTAPHLWGVYINGLVLFQFVTANSRTRAPVEGGQKAVSEYISPLINLLYLDLIPIIRRKATSDVLSWIDGDSIPNTSKSWKYMNTSTADILDITSSLKCFPFLEAI
jgi:hypothetical protein